MTVCTHLPCQGISNYVYFYTYNGLKSQVCHMLALKRLETGLDLVVAFAAGTMYSTLQPRTSRLPRLRLCCCVAVSLSLEPVTLPLPLPVHTQRRVQLVTDCCCDLCAVLCSNVLATAPLWVAAMRLKCQSMFQKEVPYSCLQVAATHM